MSTTRKADAPIAPEGTPESNDRGYRLKDDVLIVEQHNVARLLDLARGRFYGLDAIATEMVILTQKHGKNEAVRRISAEYDAPQPRVRRDLAKLMEDLRKRGLLVRNATTLRSKISTGVQAQWQGVHELDPMVLWVSRVSRGLVNAQDSRRVAAPYRSFRQQIRQLLIWAWFSLRLRGWKSTIDLCQNRQNASSSVDSVRRGELIVRTDHAIREIASRRYLFPVACKERAIVAYHVLRNVFGLPAALIVGVQQYPFLLHAWVECEGQVITDDREHVETFVIVRRYA